MFAHACHRRYLHALKQDGRLAPAYFSPNYKYFDQLLQTVKNKTTRVFTNINSTTDFCTLCKKVSRFSVEKFLSHSAEKFRRGTLLCFRKFLAPKNVRDKRGGGYHDFPSKLFCLQVPKNFAGEPFSVSLISGIEKFYASEGCVTIFRRKFFVSVPKNFVGEPFCAVFQKISGSEKVYG